MLAFVASGLYFIQDKNNFINPILQVECGSGSNEKSTGSGGPKTNGSGSMVKSYYYLSTNSGQFRTISSLSINIEQNFTHGRLYVNIPICFFCIFRIRIDQASPYPDPWPSL